MTPEREAEIRRRNFDMRDGGVRVTEELLAEVGAEAADLGVVSEIGCECTCHVPDVDEGDHDDECDGPCTTCRVADALWPEQRRVS